MYDTNIGFNMQVGFRVAQFSNFAISNDSNRCISVNFSATRVHTIGPALLSLSSSFFLVLISSEVLNKAFFVQKPQFISY